jgi:hypothetical protein
VFWQEVVQLFIKPEGCPKHKLPLPPFLSAICLHNTRHFYRTQGFLEGIPRLYPNVEKAEGAADARRSVRQAQGEAIVAAGSLTTQQMLYHRLSRRVDTYAWDARLICVARPSPIGFDTYRNVRLNSSQKTP